jgi:hypothetical protein
MAEGIELQRLPARIGYHLSVVRLGRRIEDGGPLASAARELTARWRGAGLGNDAEAWLRSVDSLLKGAGEEEIAYHEVGPGRVGWVVEPYQGGRRLVYSWLRGSEPAVRLAFRLVESPETGAFYMTETEVPASMLFEFALSDDKAGRVLPTLDPDWAPLEDPRPGPRVWTWRRDRGEDRGIRSCRRWTSRSQGDEADYYAPRLIDDVERPTPNHPLQRVSPAAAAVIAGLVGCRLPTEGEWGAAYASVGSPGASDEWNLRDRSFDAQRTHVESRPGSSVRRWPDEGAFSPSENAVRRGPGAESHPWSDGRLWFEEVDSGRDRPFRHLIGNVGEYVLRDGSLHGLMTDRFDATTPEIIQTTRREPAAFAVIGASALSPPGRPVSSAVPMEFDGRPGGYTDVGFRLVFTPRGDASSAVGVGELLRDAPFLRGPVPDNP